MNSMTRSVLTLASYDPDAADLAIDNVLRQCMQLMSIFPMLAVYGYHAYNHYEHDDSMYIHRPDRGAGIGEQDHPPGLQEPHRGDGVYGEGGRIDKMGLIIFTGG